MSDTYTILPKDLMLRIVDDHAKRTRRLICTRDAKEISPDTVLIPTAKRVELLQKAGMTVPDSLRVVDMIRAFAATADRKRARVIGQLYFLNYDAMNMTSDFEIVEPTKYGYLCGEPPKSAHRRSRGAK